MSAASPTARAAYGQARADGSAVQESEQDEPDERDEEAQRHLLFAGQQL